MRKILLILSLIVIISVFMVGYVYYYNSIDTKYAIDFSKAFKDYDISDVDEYLSKNTIIVCNGKKNTYDNLRTNVLSACNEKKYLFSNGSSYGYGNDKFIEGIQCVDVKLYGKLNDESIGEANILLKLKKIGLFKFEIIYLECDEPIFEYLFYGN